MPRGLPDRFNGPWRRVRLAILERDGHLCRVRLPGCTVVAMTVDHIVSPLEAPHLNLDPENLRACCRHCNSARENRRRAALARLAREVTTDPTQRSW